MATMCPDEGLDIILGQFPKDTVKYTSPLNLNLFSSQTASTVITHAQTIANITESAWTNYANQDLAAATWGAARAGGQHRAADRLSTGDVPHGRRDGGTVTGSTSATTATPFASGRLTSTTSPPSCSPRTTSSKSPRRSLTSTMRRLLVFLAFLVAAAQRKRKQPSFAPTRTGTAISPSVRSPTTGCHCASR